MRLIVKYGNDNSKVVLPLSVGQVLLAVARADPEIFAFSSSASIGLALFLTRCSEHALNEKLSLPPRVVAAWDGSSHFDERTALHIPPSLASSFGIRNGDEVDVDLATSKAVPAAVKVFLSPLTDMDYRLTVASQEYIESELLRLRRLQTVTVGVIVTIDCEAGNVARFMITEIRSASGRTTQHAYLAQDTDLVIDEISVLKSEVEVPRKEDTSSEDSRVPAAHEEYLSAKTSQYIPVLPEEFLSKALTVLRCTVSYADGQLHASRVLLYGAVGSGRSTFAGYLLHCLTKSFEFESLTLRCGLLASLSDKDIVDVLSTSLQKLKKCVAKHCIILLDDLDLLCTPRSTEEGLNVTVLYYIRCILLCTRGFCESDPLTSSVTVLVTCVSKDALLQYTEHSPFDAMLSVPSLENGLDRWNFFIHEAKSRDLRVAVAEPSAESLEAFSVATDGFVAADLITLLDRTEFSMRSISDSEKLQLIECTLDSAENFIPRCRLGFAQEAGTSSTPSIIWDDIGGLQEAKRALEKLLDWPVKYSFLMKQSPIRLSQGALLFGPPGCGKTLLTLAAVHRWNLRQHFVKGPELLNKYIGESERAVRDLFTRAAATATKTCPSIIIFDEFESLAPVRGARNSGVTDRIVNQLLTQLDGVEALPENVFVLACSSRPDLIDPALLRPGRIDIVIPCLPPNVAERKDIWTKVRISADSTLDRSSEAFRSEVEIVAEKTTGASGADLQSLFADARVLAVKELLSQKPDATEMPSVTKHHVECALKDFKPSIGAREAKLYKQHYFALLKRAQGERFVASSDVASPEQRMLLM